MTRKTFLISITAFAFMIPTVLFAQDSELTLQSLSDRVDTLTTSIADLTTRLESAESIWSGPGAIEFSDGTCQIGLDDHVQDETVMQYKEQYDEWLDTDSIWFRNIVYDPESGHILVTYADDIWDSAKQVTEEWNGCEFVGSSDWWQP